MVGASALRLGGMGGGLLIPGALYVMTRFNAAPESALLIRVE
jgi:hypothetical protein